MNAQNKSFTQNSLTELDSTDLNEVAGGRTIGGAGRDFLSGSSGNDTIREQTGSDLLIWNNGDGSDFLEGGAGNDFVQVNGANGAGDDF